MTDIELTQSEFAAMMDADLVALAEMNNAPIDLCRKLIAGTTWSRLRRFEKDGYTVWRGVRYESDKAPTPKGREDGRSQLRRSRAERG